MGKNGIFEIQFNNTTYNIPKSSVKFQHGYAVVEKPIIYVESDGYFGGYGDDLTLRGVIDEEYDTVFDFQGCYSQIQVFPEGNIIVLERFYDGDDDEINTSNETIHYKIVDKKANKIIKFPAGEYDQINETTIKVKDNLLDTGFEALYDVVKGQFVSEKFTVIKSFKQESKGKDRLACAILRIPYNDGTKNICTVICQIDERGNIRTPLHISSFGSLIDTTTKDFDFEKTIETIKNQMAQETENKTKIAKTFSL